MDIYRERIIELYKDPINFGEIKNPTLHSKVSNKSCGDKVELFVKIKNGKIEDVKFKGIGCAISVASASLVTEYLIGKPENEIEKITKEKVLEILGVDLTKNPSRLKCGLMILDALKELS